MRKNCLTALLSFVLVGCSGLEPFPADFVYEVDLKNKVCGKYKIVDKEKLQFEYVEDLSLAECDGVFGFSADDTGKVFTWSRNAIAVVKNQCKN